MSKSDEDANRFLTEPYQPCAVYYTDSDCVEYVKKDCFTVYERIDDFLTLILDNTKYNLIGFKLKGFKWIFEEHLKPLYELHDRQFLDLVSVIEARLTKAGDRLFADESTTRAYQAAYKLATDDHVKLSAEFFPPAHVAANALSQGGYH